MEVQYIRNAWLVRASSCWRTLLRCGGTSLSTNALCRSTVPDRPIKFCLFIYRDTRADNASSTSALLFEIHLQRVLPPEIIFSGGSDAFAVDKKYFYFCKQISFLSFFSPSLRVFPRSNTWRVKLIWKPKSKKNRGSVCYRGWEALSHRSRAKITIRVNISRALRGTF